MVRANILKQTAAEVEKQDELIAKEAEEEGGGEEGWRRRILEGYTFKSL